MDLTSAPAISLGLKVLLTTLRYKLLATPDVDQKIALCSAIFDCANAWYSTSRLIGPAPTPWSREFAAILESVPLRMDDHTTLELLIAVIDGFTTAMRQLEPTLITTVRRALEASGALLNIRIGIPKHIYDAQNTDGLKFDLRWPQIPNRPARSYQANLDPIVRSDKVLASVHRKLLSIEIPAAEICAAVPLLYPEVPPALDLVLALQTYDEGRHARQLLNALRSRNAGYQSPTVDFRIWDNMRLGQSLAEAICIEQILGEGYAIGTDLCLARIFEERGYEDLAEIHRSVHEDEFMHARQGVQWLTKLSGDRTNTLIELLEPRFGNEPPAEPWFRADLRERAGFSEAQIARQRKLAQPVRI